MPREQLTDDDFGGGDLDAPGSSDKRYDAETLAEIAKMVEKMKPAPATGRTKPAQPQK